MLMTANPIADAERHEEAAAQRAEFFDNAAQHAAADLADEVRASILQADADAVIPHVSIAGKWIRAMLTEVVADHMHDQDGELLRLLSCAALGDSVGAAQAAETIISIVAHRHAEHVCERVFLSGEVTA